MSSIYHSPKVPVLQNKVFADQKSALNSPVGVLNIQKHPTAGYYYNSEFDSEKIVYDENYDNLVPSIRFLEYYDEVGDHLLSQYRLADGPVIDIGCGKAVFLTRLIERHRSFCGIGIDPTYDGELSLLSGRITFIKDVLHKRYLESTKTPSLVICRHVLEHIPEPLAFLKEIFKAFSSHQNIPIYLEVPDLDWITRHNAFWDFCYEHVNYFDATSLKCTVESSGAKVMGIKRSFGGQYLACEAIINPEISGKQRENQTKDQEISDKELTFDFEQFYSKIINRIGRIVNKRKIIVWGMATKGVMYSQFLLNSGIEIGHCIDVNKKKQYKFVPVSGIEIEPPDILVAGEKYLVVCMNPNYYVEIADLCSSLNLDAKLVTPDIIQQ